MRRTHRIGLALGASVLLSGCDVWDRFAERFATGVAIFFAAILAPVAIGAIGALLSGRGKPAAWVDVVLGWVFATASTFFIGILAQMLEGLYRHVPWVIALPCLGLPAAAWALITSAKLARQRELPAWVLGVIALIGAGYAGWIAYVVAGGFGLV